MPAPSENVIVVPSIVIFELREAVNALSSVNIGKQAGGIAFWKLEQ